MRRGAGEEPPGRGTGQTGGEEGSQGSDLLEEREDVKHEPKRRKRHRRS